MNRFPQEQYIKSEKAKFLPPRQTLLSSLPNPVVAPEKRDFERKKLLPTRYDEQIHDIQEDFHEIIGEDDYWTTVFGFPPGEVSQVIAYFQRLGPLDEVRTVNSNRSQSGGYLFLKFKNIFKLFSRFFTGRSYLDSLALAKSP